MLKQKVARTSQKKLCTCAFIKENPKTTAISLNTATAWQQTRVKKREAIADVDKKKHDEIL